MYKTRWSVRIFEAWQAERENKFAMSEDNPFALDLTQVEHLDTSLRNMSMKSMNFWLIKFVQELSDNDGDPYPEKTIYQTVCSLRRKDMEEWKLTYWILRITGKSMLWCIRVLFVCHVLFSSSLHFALLYSLILSYSLFSFQTIRKVLDAEMKKSHRSGEQPCEKRSRKEKQPITKENFVFFQNAWSETS